MQISEWLARSVQQLDSAGISTARLDCLVLLEDVLNKNRTQILAHLDDKITEVNVRKLDILVAKRVQHIPLAYIRGKTEFYGREFIVTDSVLEPRPESETMIDLLKQVAESEPRAGLTTTVVDVGTGSGALAITTKMEYPDFETIAVDVDQNCLDLAQKNTTKHRADVEFLQGNLMRPLAKKALRPMTILLCNLPYVPNNFQINQAATHEPRHAIFGGPDGLNLYRELFGQLTDFPTVRYILCEAMPPQHDVLAKIANTAGFELVNQADFIQVFRREA